MDISARIANSNGENTVTVTTAGRQRSLRVPPKQESFGFGCKWGRVAISCLGTRYCNYLYREAQRRGIEVESVEVEVAGQFGGEGEPARDIIYSAHVAANAPQGDIRNLMRHTDTVAEIHDTLRRASSVAQM
jgi:hypothetical protein